MKMYEYDSNYEGVHRRIREMFEEARNLSQRPQFDGPFVYGFTMKFTHEGKPVVEEFGNVSPFGVTGFMEPVTDVIEKMDGVSIIVELPGITKEDVDVRTTVESLAIKVDTPFRKYSKDIRFSCKVKPETAVAKYNNGVLEITLERQDDGSKVGKRISIH
jgi:HSP20 family protein